MPNSKSKTKDLEEIRDVAIGYMDKAIQNIASIQQEIEGPSTLGSELKQQLVQNFEGRVNADLTSLNKTIERFHAGALDAIHNVADKARS